MAHFSLEHPFAPAGDQPAAIAALVEGLEKNPLQSYQTLLGATGTGKTFTIANVIQKTNRPTLVLAHNKTLAAQLFNEFRAFFPKNKVEYFVSYYDYYQPEAYIPSSGVYIEKDLSINQEIEKLRLSATAALLSGATDVIVVASVSCIYGVGNPNEINKNTLHVAVDQLILRHQFLHQLVAALYRRVEGNLERGTFRVLGGQIDIALAFTEEILRIVFEGDTVVGIFLLNPMTLEKTAKFQHFAIYPANLFVTSPENMAEVIHEIQTDLFAQIAYFEKNNDLQAAQRIRERVNYDLEMIKELGYCSGIENYSRYFDRRLPHTRPYCLIDYFPENFLMVIDESHVTIPQIRAMYGGDRSRKENLVNYGFRLPAAMDNRPLRFEEFEALTPRTIYVSATPHDYELEKSEGIIVEQIIRPTGLLDPQIEIVPTEGQIEHLLNEIQIRINKDQRILITTLTKKMAEELSDFLKRKQIATEYMHSDVDTLERVAILQRLQEGTIDVVVGVNLLREGLDLPQVSLVAIMDADKEGFLRSHRALIQTIGRAARHLEGKVLLYADKISPSMQMAMEETARRREKQQQYNEKNGIIPQALNKKTGILITDGQLEKQAKKKEKLAQKTKPKLDKKYQDPAELKKLIESTEKEMMQAAAAQDFATAIEKRNLYQELLALEKKRK